MKLKLQTASVGLLGLIAGFMIGTWPDSPRSNNFTVTEEHCDKGILHLPYSERGPDWSRPL